jgi:HD-GYP domain-containing protein (c-di-GMP phosphodiesterase class II)
MDNQALQNKSALQHLVDVSIQLSVEKDSKKLLGDILKIVMSIANCDAGSIYSITDKKSLRFETVINHTLEMYLGGDTQSVIDFPEIPIEIDGKPNSNAMVAHAAYTGEVINIPDVYAAIPFDVSAARKMDDKTGYRTQSMLVIPLKDHTDDIIGVIQLINAQDGRETIPFSEDVTRLVRSFASLGAISLTNQALVEGMERLFSSFAQTIAQAIDEKSPHTGGHCRRVPELTMMIADAIHNETRGPLASFSMKEADRHELGIAGWLHDCGKIATPDHVIEKSRKLETIFNRIHHVDAKFEIAARDIELKFKDLIFEAFKKGNTAEVTRHENDMELELHNLKMDRAFIQKINIGGEFLSDEDLDNLFRIAKEYPITVEGKSQPLLTAEELKNLEVRRGTLTEAEREIMKNHMVTTMHILEALPFPKHLKNVAEYALGHHETLDGKGYPRGLTKDQMSVQARLMAQADIFEALSAADRPYKKAKPVSECLNIMGKMVERNHLDPDIFAIFVESKVYEDYIHRFGTPDQLDDFSLEELPGYTPIQ